MPRPSPISPSTTDHREAAPSSSPGERGRAGATTQPEGRSSRPPPPVALPLRPGQIVAEKYEIERILGVGGMGVVAAAIHLELQERVAIKAMLPEAAANREYATRFAREARAAAKLKSEFVVRVTDVLRLADGTPAMVMEYLEGRTVAQLIDREGQLPVAEAVDLTLQACAALAEAHRYGIVHRDVKPANLFLAETAGEGATLKILDFGISKSDGNLSITRTRGAIGTPTHMSPEQLRSAAEVEAPADIWSLGVVLYEMLTGELPFDAPSFADLCALVLASEPTPPRWFRPDLPEALEAAILRCLRREVSERFGSVQELAAALAPFASPASQPLLERIEQLSAVRASLPSLDEGRISGVPPLRVTLPSRRLRERSSAPPAPPSAIAPTSTPSVPPPARERDELPAEEDRPAPRRRARKVWIGAAIVATLGAAILAARLGRQPPPAPPIPSATTSPGPTPPATTDVATTEPTREDLGSAAPGDHASPGASSAPTASSEPAASGGPPARADAPAARPRGSPGPGAVTPSASATTSARAPRFEDFGGRR